VEQINIVPIVLSVPAVRYIIVPPATKRLLLLRSDPCATPQKINRILIFNTKELMAASFEGKNWHLGE
jgi:hypothetical protein